MLRLFLRMTNAEDARQCAKNTQRIEIRRIQDHSHRSMQTKRIEPILNIEIALIVDVPGIEVQVPSLSNLWRSMWILTSRGKERFVNEIHRHKPGIVNDTSLLRTKEENFENVSFESVKLASGNRGYGSEDSDTAKSNDKPSSELRKTAISTTFATSSRSGNSIVNAR